MLESQIHNERMIEKEIKMGKTKATTVTLHEVSPKAPADILLGVPFFLQKHNHQGHKLMWEVFRQETKQTN